MTDLRYNDVERALAFVLEIKSARMGAFRARLRHLRNIGLPKLPKPGSGQPIAYTKRHALEMLVALQLENIGDTPKSAASLAKLIVQSSPHSQGSPDSDAGGDAYAIIGPSTDDRPPHFAVVFGQKAVRDFIGPQTPLVFSVINVSAAARKLFATIDAASTA